VCKVKLLKTEIHLLHFEALAISKIQIQAALQHHTYSLYGQHYFFEQCIFKLFRPMWHIYFSVMGQFWVYFMVISLFHYLYFMNSAQWKTSILHLRGSCIYLHNWLADGIFFSLSYKCAVVQNLLWCSSPWTQEVNKDFFCKINNMSHQ